jgi:hypothetical protein
MRQDSTLVAEGYHPLEADLRLGAPAIPAEDGQAAPAARGALAFWPWLVGAVVLVSTVEWWVDARGR